MVSLRVFVSAAAATSPQQEADLAQHLLTDLKRAGADVVIDDGTIPDTQFLVFLERELPRCHWLVVLKTAVAVRSLRVQATVNAGYQLLKKQEMKGVIEIVCPSFETVEKPLAWPEIQTIPFHGDYPRVRDKLLLELELLRVDDIISKDVSRIPTERLAFNERGSVNQKPPILTYPEKVPAYPAIGGDLTTAAARKAARRFALPNIPLNLQWKWKWKTAAVSAPAGPNSQIDRPVALPPRTRRNLRLGLIVICSSLVFLLLCGVYIFKFGWPTWQRAASPTPAVQSTSAPHSQILAQDTFRRANQLHWGKASDGQLWTGDANTSGAFSMHGNTGQIANMPGVYATTLGPPAADVDVTMSGTINAFADDLIANMGIVLRVKDANHWYKVLINGAEFSVVRSDEANKFKTLDSVPFAAQGKVNYTLRFRAIGRALSAKVWPTNQPEPADWMITVDDKSITSGLVGIRVVLEEETQVNVTAFQAKKATA